MRRSSSSATSPPTSSPSSPASRRPARTGRRPSARRGGGAGANVAVHLARLGRARRPGRLRRRRRRRRRRWSPSWPRPASQPALRTVPGAATGTSSAWSSRAGSAACSPTAGRTWRCRPDDVPAPARRAGTCTCPATRCWTRGPRGAGLAALAAAVAAGAPSRWTRPRPARWPPTAWTGGWPTPPAATLLLPNADEARLLTGCADAADAARALAGRHPVVAVSLGRRRRAVGVRGRRWCTGRRTPTTVRRHHRRRRRVRRRAAGGLAAAPGRRPGRRAGRRAGLAAEVVRRPGRPLRRLSRR